MLLTYLTRYFYSCYRIIEIAVLTEFEYDDSLILRKLHYCSLIHQYINLKLNWRAPLKEGSTVCNQNVPIG
jgi:hypothetical protein